MRIKTLKEIKNDIIFLKEDLEEYTDEIKKSDIYEKGLQVSDALKDIRDSFKRMYAEDYYRFMSSTPDLQLDAALVSGLIRIASNGNTQFKRFYDQEELIRIILDELNNWDSFSKVKLYKRLVDPIDCKFKTFMIGELFGKEDAPTLDIVCNGENISRYIRNTFIARGYTYKENEKYKLMTRIKNTLKN